MDSLRIVVADDHDLVRTGLKDLLESTPGWKVVGEAANGRQAVEMARRLRPDVVVLDVNMPVLNGVETARQISKLARAPEMLVLTVSDSEALAHSLLQAGVRGFLLKSDTVRDLHAAVDALRQHRPYFTARITGMILEAYLSSTRDAPAGGTLSSLTSREREVLQLIAEGTTNKEVAAALHMAVKTAEVHRANIMRKLELNSVSDLVRYAVRNGLVVP